MEKEEIVHTQKVFIKVQTVFLLVLVLLFAAYLYMRITPAAAPTVEPTTLSLPGTIASDFPYINPAVTANLGKHFIINFKPLSDKLNAITSEYSYKSYVYFDYLNNAAWLGTNYGTAFTAGSTVKVPLAMSVYKMAEDGKISLTQEYSFSQLGLDASFIKTYGLDPAGEITLAELLRIMLVNSDTKAQGAIAAALGISGVTDPFSNVYQTMGWPELNNTDTQYNLINMTTLSNMFIALYNATYDNSQDSNAILKDLDDSQFNDAIVAGVPEAVGTSHKMGSDVANLTYSDCGIVYAPNRNYILCVASQGANQTTANKFMSMVSDAVYQYVASN